MKTLRCFFFSLALIVLAVDFTGCSKNVSYGKQAVSPEALQWTQFEETVWDFQNEKGETLRFHLSASKQNYNTVQDCYQKGIKEVCDLYESEQVFRAANTSDNQLSLTVAVSRAIKKGNLFDLLNVMLVTPKKAEIISEKVVYLENPDLPTQTTEPQYKATWLIGNQFFEDVFVEQQGEKVLYYTQKQGVVGFTLEGELWVRVL